MYKDKAKQREANKGYQRRRRQGVTGCDTIKGVTFSTGGTEGVTGIIDKLLSKPVQGVTLEGMPIYPDILDKLTNPVWRDRLTKLQAAFENSHHPDYASACWLGDCNLSFAFDLLECTA